MIHLIRFAYRVQLLLNVVDLLTRAFQEPQVAVARRVHEAGDGAAIALARDNDLPVIVFSIDEPGNLLKLLRGLIDGLGVLARGFTRGQQSAYESCHATDDAAYERA